MAYCMKIWGVKRVGSPGRLVRGEAAGWIAFRLLEDGIFTRGIFIHEDFMRSTSISAYAAILTAVLLPSCLLSQSNSKPHPKVIALERSDNGIQPILIGPPETASMKSGYVVLDPGHSVGKHSTENHEEILVVLEGQGEMLFRDGSKLELKARTALYCPPATEHDVKNTGSAKLRYVYVVANAQ